VLALLRAEGVPALEADAAYADLVRPGGELLPRLAEAFGSRVLLPDGTLDRELLAKLAFADPTERERLDAVTHPALRERIAGWLNEVATSGAAVAAVEAAVLFEADIASLCTERWYVDAPARVRAERLTRSRGWDPPRVDRLIAAQQHLEAHRARCDRLIDGTRPEADLRSTVREWLASTETR
jgi:dephospho-CoA kinase